MSDQKPDAIRVVAALIFDNDGKILITKRPAGSHLGGKWEFPGGKIHENETPQEALIREIREELGMDITVGRLFWEDTFDYSVKIVKLSFYCCAVSNGNFTVYPLQVDDFRWVNRRELQEFEFPPADAQLIVKLISE